MNIRDKQNNFELIGMAVLCKVIDFAESVISLFNISRSEQVVSEAKSDDFDFSFDFETCSDKS